MKDMEEVVKDAAIIIKNSRALGSDEFIKVVVEQLCDVYNQGHVKMMQRTIDIIDDVKSFTAKQKK